LGPLERDEKARYDKDLEDDDAQKEKLEKYIAEYEEHAKLLEENKVQRKTEIAKFRARLEDLQKVFFFFILSDPFSV